MVLLNLQLRDGVIGFFSTAHWRQSSLPPFSPVKPIRICLTLYMRPDRNEARIDTHQKCSLQSSFSSRSLVQRTRHSSDSVPLLSNLSLSPSYSSPPPLPMFQLSCSLHPALGLAKFSSLFLLFIRVVIGLQLLVLCFAMFLHLKNKECMFLFVPLLASCLGSPLPLR